MNQDPTNNKPAEEGSEKKAETDVRHIEWILAPKKTAETDFTPEYGDLSLLNETGIILRAVGRAQLRDMATEYLDLLETSTAIYEVNGDYALGLFSSGWCRMMDAASRRLCHTDDNRKALDSGKWLCHESCWQEASLPAIQKGQAVDVACKGGIRLYAVPVWAGGEVVGAINFGYGDPPTDEETLHALSEKYRLSIEELRKQAHAYPTRPQFIIDYAKRRIQTAALYIGTIIALTQAEKTLKESEDKFRSIFETANVGKSITLPTGEIDINQAFCDMLGYTRDELEGKKWQDLTPSEEIEPIQEQLAPLLAGEKDSLRFSKRYLHKEGSMVWADVSVAIKRDQTGLPQHFITTVVDITDRKHAEDELRRLKTHLETEVAEKTKALKQRVAELERFRDATIEREFRIKELRDEIARLKGGTS